MGWFSTLLMSEWCFVSGCHLTSVELNKSWMESFAYMQSIRHLHLLLRAGEVIKGLQHFNTSITTKDTRSAPVHGVVGELLTTRWGVVFVDVGNIDIRFLACITFVHRAEFVVLHDARTYIASFPGFPAQHAKWTHYVAELDTIVMSNIHDLSDVDLDGRDYHNPDAELTLPQLMFAMAKEQSANTMFRFGPSR
jgi:hypothetical protein